MLQDKDEGKLVLTEEIFDYTAHTQGATLHHGVFGDPSPNKTIRRNK